MRATLGQELRSAVREPNNGRGGRVGVGAYTTAVASVGVATFFKWAATEAGIGSNASFLFYYPTVFLSAFYGVRPGIFVSFLSAVFGGYFAGDDGLKFQFTVAHTLTAALYFCESSGAVLFISGLRGTLLQLRDREAQLNLFANVGRTLSREDDFKDSLQAAAELAIGTFSEVVVIDVILPDGSLERAAVSLMPDFPESVRAKIHDTHVDRESSTDPIAAVLRTGVPTLTPELESRHVFSFAIDRADALNNLPIGSSMVLPLAGRRHMWGTITLARTIRTMRYTAADFLYGQELANRIATQLERMQLVDELARANRSKDDFLGVLSHEMRSPITVIKGGVDLLLDDVSPLSPDQRIQLTRTVRAEAERLGTLFDNLLALATGTDNAPLELEPSPLHGFLNEFVPLLGERLGESRITVRSDGQLPLVEIVTSYVEQILRNLLTNAQKYSPPESPILVDARVVDGTWVCISVTDAGPGVPEEELEHIFMPYYRTTDGRRKAAGFGVGLGVARQLAELMGGKLHAELPPEGGFRVVLTLPAVAPQPEI